MGWAVTPLFWFNQNLRGYLGDFASVTGDMRELMSVWMFTDDIRETFSFWLLYESIITVVFASETCLWFKLFIWLRGEEGQKTKHHCKKTKNAKKNCYCVRKKNLLCGIKVKADFTHHLGSKLAGALMSHNSFLFFLRFCARVLLQGSWQKETKSGGHWYLVVLSVD